MSRLKLSIPHYAAQRATELDATALKVHEKTRPMPFVKLGDIVTQKERLCPACPEYNNPRRMANEELSIS